MSIKSVGPPSTTIHSTCNRNLKVDAPSQLGIRASIRSSFRRLYEGFRRNLVLAPCMPRGRHPGHRFPLLDRSVLTTGCPPNPQGGRREWRRRAELPRVQRNRPADRRNGNGTRHQEHVPGSPSRLKFRQPDPAGVIREGGTCPRARLQPPRVIRGPRGDREGVQAR